MMNAWRVSCLLGCCFLFAASVQAAPLNKFGNMTQQAPPMQVMPPVQQAAPTYLPPPVQHRPTPAPPAEHNDTLKRLRQILSHLSPDRVKAWQQRFIRKRDEAEKASKIALQRYYDQLVALCQQIIDKKREETR